MQRMRRRSRRRSKQHRRRLKFLNTLYRIDGLRILFLSPLTQQFVGCDIGNKILPNIPWIFVDKERIETHIDFYQTDSCFYPIKKEIEACPTELILLGSYCIQPDKPANFFICTTINAEQQVLKLLDDERTCIEKFVLRMQSRTAGFNWQSYGSEEEIEAEMQLNNRNLYVIEVRSINLTKQKYKFKMSFAEDRTNGYVEMLQGLNIYSPVMRKRLDRGVQASPDFIHREVQTDSLGTYTKSIQYCYEYSEIKLTQTLATTINKFLLKEYSSLHDYLDDNTCMRINEADYQNLAISSEEVRLHKPIDIKTYSDIRYSISKKVSCLCWNSLISGRLAVAYVKYPLFYILKAADTQPITSDPKSDPNLVLIWDYADTEKPKLFLHCREEVSSMSFCPYNENILITGYTNGQISIWDLTDCYDNKFRKFTTLREHRNSIPLLELSNWFMNTTKKNHVFPTLTSTPNVSHSSPVTSILWFPPKSLEVQDQYYLKFITSGLDDNAFFIWIIDPTQILHSELDRFSRRKFEKPAFLNQGMSVLRGLKKFFVPSKKLYLGDTHHLRNHPVLRIMQNDFYSYEIENPDTTKDLDTHTIFKITGTQHFLDADKKVLFTCGLGESFVASCVGAEMSNEKNFQICCVKQMQPVHDGPILVCETNGFFHNIVLTVGGSVFAIWDCSKTNVALFWRKSNHRYLSGMWCFHRPLSILLLRNDRHFDYWNACESSMAPIQTFKYTGYQPIMFYGDSNKFHVRKNTFIVTDKSGNFKTLLLPTETLDQDLCDIYEAQDFIQSNLDLKNHTKLLQMKFKKMKEQSISTQESVITAKSIVKTEEEAPLSRAAFFQKKLEEYGVSVLLALRNIPVDPDTDSFKFSDCDKTAKTTDKQLRRQQSSKRKTIQHIKDRISFDCSRVIPKRCEYKVTRDPDLAKALKIKYIEQYKELENNYKIHLLPNQRRLSKEFQDISMRLFTDKYTKLYRRGLPCRHREDLNKILKPSPFEEICVNFQSATELL